MSQLIEISNVSTDSLDTSVIQRVRKAESILGEEVIDILVSGRFEKGNCQHEKELFSMFSIYLSHM